MNAHLAQPAVGRRAGRALLVTGAAFALIGGVALVKRFFDFFKRLHGPTKATTLGVGGVLLASAPARWAGWVVSLRD